MSARGTVEAAEDLTFNVPDTSKKASVLAVQGSNCGSMLKHLLPPNLKRVIVYLRPINMRWGTAKLRALCRDELGIEPNYSTAFVFANQSQDCLLLYSMDSEGDRTLMKKIEKGAFIMPAPRAEGTPYVIMKPAVLSRMFKA